MGVELGELSRSRLITYADRLAPPEGAAMIHELSATAMHPLRGQTLQKVTIKMWSGRQDSNPKYRQPKLTDIRGSCRIATPL
jgi:hypothetical protein